MAELVMRLPAITTEMDEGRLLTWMVTVGQAVKEGDPICEFTTDKVDTELESPYTGTITKLLVPEGGSVRVGDAIALIEGDAPNFLGDLDAALAPETDVEAAEPVNLVDEHEGDEPSDAETEPSVVPAPRAVRLEAERRGIDLTDVIPTGSRGQVTMADLDALAPAQADDTDLSTPDQVALDDEPLPGLSDWDAVDGAADTAISEGEPDDTDAQSAALAESEATTGASSSSDEPLTAVAQGEDTAVGEPSLAAQRPQERRGRRAERTGGRRRGRRRQEHTPVDQVATPEPVQDAPVSEFMPDATPAPAPDEAAFPVFAAVDEASITIEPGHTVDTPVLEMQEPAVVPATPPTATPPVVHEVRVESAPPFTLYAQLDVTDCHSGSESGLALLSRLVWAYGQALWEQPEANAMWDHQDQTAVPLDTVYVDLGIETVASTMETVPIAVPKDAPIAQIGLSVTNAYGLVRQGTPPEVHVPQRSATLIDLGPWRVERFTPVIQPPQVTALSVGEIQTVPSLVGRTVTIRQIVTIGITIDTRVLDPVQAASLLATIIDHATRGDGLDQSA